MSAGCRLTTCPISVTVWASADFEYEAAELERFAALIARNMLDSFVRREAAEVLPGAD